MSALDQKVRQGYKQSEVGIIPDEWDVLLMDEVTDSLSSGATPFRGNSSFYKGSNRWITSGELKYGVINDTIEKISDEAIKKANLKVHPSGTFLMAITGLEAAGTRGSCGIVGKPATTNQSCMAIYPNKKLKSNYLFHWYVYNGDELAFKYCQGTKQLSYTAGLLKTIPVLVPRDTTEQTAIANALSDVDSLLAELEKLIGKKQAIKTATMQQLLTGKTRLPQFASYTKGEKQGQPKGTKPSELGEIPEDWDVDKIGSIVSITTGNKNTQDKLSDGKYPFFVRSQKVERINSYSFDGEAVLTAGDGVGTGKIFHYINGKFDYHQRVYLMHNFGERIDGYYFYIYFSNYFYDRIMSMTAKSSVDSVRREMIAEMPIYLPSKAEQKAIATILSDMDSEIQTLEQRLAKTRQIKQGMMQELLTGRTRLPFKKES